VKRYVQILNKDWILEQRRNRHPRAPPSQSEGRGVSDVLRPHTLISARLAGRFLQLADPSGCLKAGPLRAASLPMNRCRPIENGGKRRLAAGLRKDRVDKEVLSIFGHGVDLLGRESPGVG